jgi:predicted secreted protein
MKRLMNVRVFVAVLAVACLIVLLMAIPSRSSIPPGQYDPWLDVNNDGVIDGGDLSMVARDFGTGGQNITKASVDYNSGWINITNKAGQNIIVTHGLNSTDIMVDIQGKTTLDGGSHQRYYGLTPYMPGWSQTYGGTNYERALSVVATGDGGYALAGYTNSFGAGSNDFWLVKTDSAGNMLWNKTYGGTGDDEAYSLVQTGDGGYALAGYTNSFGAGGYDFWLVKTDATGNMQWNKTYGGTGDDEGGFLVQTADGGYALTGLTTSFGAGIADFWLVKTNASGNMQWNKTYGGTGADDPSMLVQTGDGGYALIGITNSFGAGGWDFWLVKTNATGNMQWNKTYGGTGDEVANCLVQTADGGYALTGLTTSFGAGIADFWLVKTDASGNMQWNKTYGGTGDDEAYSLIQTRDGGYALAGYTNSFGAGGYDFWLVKTDVESGLAWVDSSANTITLYRGATDPWWNYVRVKIWQVINP